MKTRFLIAISCIAVLIPLEVYAGDATQTGWSGGDGIWGPVLDWSEEFYMDIDIQCYTDPDNITIRKTMADSPVEHLLDTSDGIRFLYSADINNDGTLDVLGASYAANSLTWWENSDTSPGNYWTRHFVDDEFGGAHSIHSDDLDGDGDMDVLATGIWVAGFYWWDNTDGTGNSWTERYIGTTYNSSCLTVESGDFNGDGFMDVLGGGNYQVLWWENVNGTGTSWVEHSVVPTYYGVRSLRPVDINDDGYLDILGGACFSIDGVTWWENVNGTGNTWTEHIIDPTLKDANSVYYSDINGDGYMDVIGACFYDTDEIIWWENVDGSGTSWTEHIVDGAFEGGYSVYSADLNGDGWMDILGAAYDDDDITWWENTDGTGTSWTEHTLNGDFDGAYWVHAADINGDSYKDVLGAASIANDISWWDLTESYPADGLLESSVLDIQESPNWQAIDWTCTEPSGTDIAFQVRASDNPSSMGAWSDTLESPCSLDGILTDETRYFQYRAILATTDPLSTPVLQDVMVTWNPYGIEEESGTDVYALYGAQPNPAFNSVRLVFSLPSDSRAELMVYDLTGRVVSFNSDEYLAGVNEVIMDDLACGVYLVRMNSEGFSATQQFVVID